MSSSSASSDTQELLNIAAAAERARDHNKAGEALERLAQLGAATGRTELRCTLNFILSRRFPEATAALRRAETLSPDAPQLWPVRIELTAAQRRWSDMAAVARAWLSIAPQQVQAREALARALLESGDLDGAAEAFQPIIAANPTPSAAHALTYGRICLNAQRFEEAETYLSAALKQTPNAPDALVAKARLATFHGDTEGAKELCERAIAQDPNHPRAYQQLAIVTRGRLEERHKHAIERLRRGDGLEPLMRAAMGFALADAAFRERDAETALDLYNHANAQRYDVAQSQNERYDRAAMERDVDALIEAAPALLSASVQADSHSSPNFLFVIGFPRSGTTLVESILAAHPSVAAGGERAAGPRYSPTVCLGAAWERRGKGDRNIDDRIRKYQKIYINTVQDITPATHLTDKMPGNSLAAPLLAALFPNARFIACRRDPFDVAISIYRHQFQTPTAGATGWRISLISWSIMNAPWRRSFR